MNNIERFRGRDRFIFFLGGIFAPFIFLILYTLIFNISILTFFLSKVLLNSFVNLPHLLDLRKFYFIILFILYPIALIIFLLNFFIRISKIQFRKFRNQGGKLSKNKVTLLAFTWWMINSIPISFCFFATWYLLLLLIFGSMVIWYSFFPNLRTLSYMN